MHTLRLKIMTQITLKQLPTQLKNKLSPVYLLSGDEPLFLQEARDAIFAACKSNGFGEKELFHVDASFRPESLIGAIQNQSLFAEKKIIDIRNPAAKFDPTLVTFFQQFFSNPCDDYVIVISTDKLTAAQQKSDWCETIKKHGVFIPIWPLQLNEFPQWITDRAKQLSIQLPGTLSNLLAAYCEGNLLAAHQALEKLKTLYPSAEITREQLISVIADDARFNIFDLSDAMMRNDTKKISRILTRLEQTGEEPTLVLWAICRKLRENSNHPKTKKALQHAAIVDEIIKGGKPGNAWQALLTLCLA
jgi:DNA polymerase-3 subunit delta